MQIHPIRNDDDHRKALARIEVLMAAPPNSPEGDELDIWATLVDAYESKHFQIDAPTPIAAIRFRMEQRQLSRKDLEPMIGSRARVSEVLSGKRELTLTMVRRVRRELGISADLLITPISPNKNRSGSSHKSARTNHSKTAGKNKVITTSR